MTAGASSAGEALEVRIQRIVAEALGRPRVGVDDDFFAIGGDSMAAVATVGRIRQELGIDLPVALFFEAATVAGLACLLRERFER